MQRKFTLTLLVSFLAFGSYSQYTRHIVEFRDKKGTQFTLANPSNYLSAKAIQRRASNNIIIDSTDLPLSKAYVDSIAAIPNVTILNKSKWFNQLLIRTSDPTALAKINSFPFVKTTTAIAPTPRLTEEVISQKIEKEYQVSEEILSKIRREQEAFETSGINLDYGNTFNQIHIHEGEFLHNLGFTGKGITIAILDAGFRSYKTNPVFDSARLQGRILGEWDFVNNEASVVEDDTHGANCFSIIASNRPGVLVGSAPHASFWLFRTEDVFSEYPVEEQNWVAAAEFADSAGTDMISTSLGYHMFDNPAFNHTYPQRNGNFSLITRASDLAASKGILLTNSAGNDGARADEYKFVACPADADSILTVGAVTNAGLIANFSSWGPNGAGKLKPNVVSVGQGTIFATTTGNPTGGNGTSFSNPNMAGLVACLWQAFPEFSNMEIIDYVQRSSDKFNTPDIRYGYGLPNFRKAFEMLTEERRVRNMNNILGAEWIRAFPVPFTKNLTIILKAPTSGSTVLELTDAKGSLIEEKSINVIADQIYNINFNKAAALNPGVYFIKYLNGKTRTILRIVK